MKFILIISTFEFNFELKKLESSFETQTQIQTWSSLLDVALEFIPYE
jgi:hypothetical protein